MKAAFFNICKMESVKPQKITFITGNAKKLEEFQAIMSDLPELNIDNMKLDLEEYQGTSEEIALKKAKLAATYCDNPVLVEDTSLGFTAYGGLPGPYIKDFLKNLQPEGLHKMASAFEDHSATAMCIFGYCENKDSEPILFVGKCEGKIVEPKGSRDFGWDPVFQPVDYELTFAELDKDIKNKISHRSKAIEKLKEFLNSKN